MGCGLCAWACPYGAREMDLLAGVMKKCTLCVDRIYNENIPEEDREPACVRPAPRRCPPLSATSLILTQTSRASWPSGAALTSCPNKAPNPSTNTSPPRPKDTPSSARLEEPHKEPKGFLAWLDKALEAI